MTTFDSIFGTAEEVALSAIELAVARSRVRMDAEEAALVRGIESFLAHPSQERPT